jgi:tRNA threonylcarbamoyladenosine biosynthesis protein TsaB
VILALTTSTPIASVALVDEGRVLAEIARGDPRGHAEHLFDLVDRALEAAGRTRADIRAVSCDIGPGSFTGVRIAVASAKGIAEGLGVPLAGVVSLEAMAAAARDACAPHTLVAALIDAKKDELYIAVYDGERVLLAPSHVPRSAVAERIVAASAGRPFVAVADVDDLSSALSAAERSIVAPPSAAWIGRIAASRLAALAARGEAMDPAEVVPLYVRAPDAIPSFAADPQPATSAPAASTPTDFRGASRF